MYTKIFKNGNINVKRDMEKQGNEYDNMMVMLAWEDSLDFCMAGDDGCAGNFDMYSQFYSYKTDMLYLVLHNEAKKWKSGKMVKLYGRKITEEERVEIEEYMNG